MNIKIQEDSRTLCEFYPDPKLRGQVHYAFAHQFVPQYVQQNPYAFFAGFYQRDQSGGVLDPTRFIQSRWSAIFERRAGLVPEQGILLAGQTVFRRVTDLSMSVQELAGRASALIQMPRPEQPVEAYFVCVVLLASASDAGSWTREVQARVFTLEAEVTERPEGRMGIVCEWTKQGGHQNFGFGIPIDRNGFLDVIAGILDDPRTQVAASFTPRKSEAPAALTPSGQESAPPPLQPTPSPATKKPWWKIW